MILKKKRIEKIFKISVNAFPIWVLLGATLALWKPETALWFKPNWIPTFLGLIMLCMGLTLEVEDFVRVLKIPRSVLLGVGLQYLIMPLIGYMFALGFNLQMDYVIGLVLVASCPGGTASNVVCFIARTNIALSVTLTACSTLLAVLTTPLLTTLMVESVSDNLIDVGIEVDTLGLLIKTFKVVVLPVIIGVFLNFYFHKAIRYINTYTPLLAVFSIVLIVDYILGAKKDFILDTGLSIMVAVIGLHLFGFLLGYLLSKLLGFKDCDARTISIEVGMQNSGLAAELARSTFPAYSLATVPGAISALTHCIFGSIAAGLFRIYHENNDV